MTILLQLPQVERSNFMRPQQCPACKGETFQGWGTVRKRIKDTKVRVRRYRCTTCGQTFRHYPHWVTAAQQSERLMKLCVVIWSLGLSLSHMSGWRDVQAEGQRLHAIWRQMPGRSTRPDEARTALEKLRGLVLRLSRDWPRYIAFYDDPGIPWTNNATERIIGRLKNRAKRVRGYKNSQGRLIGSLIASQTWI